jgi:hypothetical protein
MIAIGTLLRAKRVGHLSIRVGSEVRRIAGAVGRGNVKGNSGLLLLSSSEQSMAFLVGDRGRTWRYAVTW